MKNSCCLFIKHTLVVFLLCFFLQLGTRLYVDFVVYMISVSGPIPNGDVEKGSKSQANSNLVEILPVYRQDSHLSVFGGSHDFPGDGTYLLKFDNSYSLWRNKTLYYRVYYSAWDVSLLGMLFLITMDYFWFHILGWGGWSYNIKVKYIRHIYFLSLPAYVATCWIHIQIVLNPAFAPMSCWYRFEEALHRCHVPMYALCYLVKCPS